MVVKNKDLSRCINRSDLMSRVRQRGTWPELVVRSGLHRRGLRFRVNMTSLPGSPDLVFPRHSAVLFVHGCFWHRHHCHLATTPKTNAAFRAVKFLDNMERDRRIERQLRRTGYKVIKVWQCQLQRSGDNVVLMDRIASRIRSRRSTEAFHHARRESEVDSKLLRFKYAAWSWTLVLGGGGSDRRRLLLNACEWYAVTPTAKRNTDEDCKAP